MLWSQTDHDSLPYTWLSSLTKSLVSLVRKPFTKIAGVPEAIDKGDITSIPSPLMLGRTGGMLGQGHVSIRDLCHFWKGATRQVVIHPALSWCPEIGKGLCSGIWIRGRGNLGANLPGEE